MNFLTQMERKYGKYAISNLPLYIVALYAAGYLIQLAAPNMMSFLILEPAYIMQGQIWRVVSWLLIPPGGVSLFTIITLYFYYYVGKTLERTWGAFRYNVYIFFGIIMTIIGAFVLYFLSGGGDSLLLLSYGYYFSTYYIAMSSILAFATTYGEVQVLYMMIIPIKMKYMAVFYLIMIAVEFVRGSWGTRVAILCSLLNYVIFLLMTKNIGRYHPKEIRRKQEFKKAVAKSRVNPATGGITKHKCAICGRTEKDGANLEFRYCSKCNGNYEYCQDHLFTHKHVE